MRALNLSGGKNIYFFSLTKDFFVYLKKMLFTFCQENKSKSRSPVKIITHFFHVSTHIYIYISKYRQCWWQLWRFSTYTLKNVLWICIKHRRDRMMLEPWRDFTRLPNPFRRLSIIHSPKPLKISVALHWQRTSFWESIQTHTNMEKKNKCAHTHTHN